MIRYIALLTASLCACLSSAVCAELELADAYIRGLPPGVENTAAYMTIINSGEAPVELTHASSPIAGSVTLHNTMEHDGMLHMMSVDSAVIPAKSKLLLQSGGMHLMLMDLKELPQAGDQVELILHFADGNAATFTVPVRSVLEE